MEKCIKIDKIKLIRFYIFFAYSNKAFEDIKNEFLLLEQFFNFLKFFKGYLKWERIKKNKVKVDYQKLYRNICEINYKGVLYSRN